MRIEITEKSRSWLQSGAWSLDNLPESEVVINDCLEAVYMCINNEVDYYKVATYWTFRLLVFKCSRETFKFYLQYFKTSSQRCLLRTLFYMLEDWELAKVLKGYSKPQLEEGFKTNKRVRELLQRCGIITGVKFEEQKGLSKTDVRRAITFLTRLEAMFRDVYLQRHDALREIFRIVNRHTAEVYKDPILSL